MPLTKTAELALRQSPECHHMFGIPGDDRRRGVANGSSHATSTAPPMHIGELNLRNAQGPGESCGIVAIVAIGSEPIDIFDTQTGISHCLLDGFERQLELADRRLARLVITRFTNTNNGDFVLDGIIRHVLPPFLTWVSCLSGAMSYHT